MRTGEQHDSLRSLYRFLVGFWHIRSTPSNCRNPSGLPRLNRAAFWLVALGLVCPCLRASTITDIVGPVIPYGSSPWQSYDLTEKAAIDLVAPAALAWPPLIGSALPGTYTMTTGAPATLVGTMAPGVAMGDQLVVGWNSPDGTGQGRLWGTVAGVSGNTITFSIFDNAGLSLAGNLSPIASTTLTGLTVYACTRCNTNILDPTYGTGIPVYNTVFWGLEGQNTNFGWNFYDPALAVYRMYLRTSNSTYLTEFRTFVDTWWTWAITSGGLSAMGPPRWYSLASQFVRALDIGGSVGTARLNAIYTMVQAGYTFNVSAHLDGQDNREPGYFLMWTALGAKADATNRAAYCSMLTTLTSEAIGLQQSNGSWYEKNGQYAYAMPGMSPWRVFALNQALARGYPVLADTSASGCNQPALAANVLTALQASAAYIYNSGYDSGGRDVFYDTNYPDDGEFYTVVSGTCNPTDGSTAITCSGVNLQSTFNCNGTDYIGMMDPLGRTWTGKLASCSSQTAGTLSAAWDGTEQTAYCAYLGVTPCSGPMGVYTAGSYTGVQTSRALPASTSCGSASTPFCLEFGNSQQAGFQDRSGNFDAIWIMGWLYNQTGATIWKTRGDDLFSAAYGGPATGPQISPGACGGPGCDGYQAGYTGPLTGCGSNSNVPPCNPFNNQPGNINAFPETGTSGPKVLGQMSGIGGADNYLAWRLGSSPSTGGFTASGGVRISGGVH
jgi:hypothetical protein